MTDLITIDLNTTPTTITVTDPEAHRTAVLLDCIAEADDMVVEVLRDTRIRIPAALSNIGARWTDPLDVDDDHPHACSCGAEVGRVEGEWVGFEVTASGTSCEWCDETGF